MKSLLTRYMTWYVILAAAMQFHGGSVRAEAWLPIAREEGPAPGVPGEPGAEYFILEAPALNDAGQVAYHSFLSAFSVEGGTSTIWAGSASHPVLVAREENAAPGTSEKFGVLQFEPLLNNAGQVLISADLSGNVSQRNGLWVGAPGNLQLLARTNTALPGLSTMIDDIDTFSLQFSDSGKATFLGTDVNGKTGLWYGSPGNLVVAARDGDSVPTGSGLSSNVKFEAFLGPTNDPAINASGTIAFRAPIANSSFTLYGESIWVGTPGNLQLLMREETAAPGAPGEEFFLINTNPVINNAGQVAFGAKLSNFHDALWIGTPGNLQLILEGNDPAPVGQAGVRFADFGTYKELRLSDSGHVGFEGWLEGAGVNSTNDIGLFRASTSGVNMVARLGSHAPGTEPGAVFEFFENYSINSSGHMAFMGTITGGGVSAGESRGIWAQDAQGVLELVVREGDWVHPLTGQVVRLIDATNPAALESQGFSQVLSFDWRSGFELSAEQGTAWNAQHQIAFEVTFEDADYGTTLLLADVGGLVGDFDHDGDVDGRDFLVWQRTDRTSAELAAWQQGYGQPGGLNAMAAIPEPATFLLLVFGWIYAFDRRYLVK